MIATTQAEAGIEIKGNWRPPRDNNTPVTGHRQEGHHQEKVKWVGEKRPHLCTQES